MLSEQILNLVMTIKPLTGCMRVCSASDVNEIFQRNNYLVGSMLTTGKNQIVEFVLIGRFIGLIKLLSSGLTKLN